MAAPRILISACLEGQPVRYNATSARKQHPALIYWRQRGLLVPVCPEVAGGLSVPRPPAELRGARVVTEQGHDVTEAFRRGAQKALDLARQRGCVMAILKARSPSCGPDAVYSGEFDGRLRAGQGITAALLESEGMPLFTEDALDEAWACWCNLAGLPTTTCPSEPSGC